MDPQDDLRRPPLPTMASSPGLTATNITDKLKSASNTLSPGDIVKDGHFTLFEAVGALEIMDPKMDSGCIDSGESLYEEYDVTKELLPEEVLGIMDQLLCLEMAWHLGYPLSQTILTSVYVETLATLPHTNIDEVTFASTGSGQESTFLFILRAYCAGLLKTCDLVNELVKDELYYEEEDFVTNSYDPNILLSDVPQKPVTDMLHKARRDLRVMDRKPRKDLQMALDHRLELRIAFLRALDISKSRTSSPVSLKLPWSQMWHLLDHIKKQYPLGKPVPKAFSTRLQRQLASTMPPRPIVQLSFDDTYDHFKRLFRDGKEVVDVLNYTDPESLLTFVSTFQARKPQSPPCIRTLLQNLMFKDMSVLGKHTIRQLIDHDLKIVVLPCAPQLDTNNDNIEVPTDPRHRMANEMDIFRQRVEECYLDVFRIFCQNRCRVRRTFCHNIQAWDALQADVEEIDMRLQEILEERPIKTSRGDIGYSLPLSSWAYLYKLRQMEWIVQLGFELSIYQTDELAGMYWYLNYLAKTRAQHGDRIKLFVTDSMETARKLPSYSSAKDVAYFQSLGYLRSTMLDAACTWEFADGLCCIYTVLQRLKLVGSASLPYSSDSLRFEVRMKPFMTIGLPQLPTFEEFTKATAQPETNIAELLTYAESAVGGAKKGYEALSKMSCEKTFSVGCHERWLGNIKDCLKAAISASLVVSTLKKSIAENGEANPKLRVEMPAAGKGFHDWWIVPKLTFLEY